jgi:hypothetical protein
MRLLDLAVVYLIVGAAAMAALSSPRARGRWQIGDALLLFTLWPLYGPFLLLKLTESAPGPAGSDVAFLLALGQARHTSLGALCPDPATVRKLARRLTVAEGKVKEIDALLGKPEFSETGALARQAELADKGASETALKTAGMRLVNIRRLRALRERFVRELDEVAEILAQLRTQAEVMRLQGTPDSSCQDLLRELLSRVEGLDEMLDDDAGRLEA